MTNMNKNITKFILAVAIIFSCAVFAAGFSEADAATMAVVANRTSVLLNQPFRIDVSLDTQRDDANALQGEIDFPAGQFTIRNIEDGESPISFWIEPPAETASGVISFSGIVPDGFQGAASSVITAWFLPVSPGPATISLHNVQLLRNDGEASPISVALAAQTITVATTATTGTPTRPVSLVTPDAFVPIISQDPNIYGGKYFLAFSTTDAGSGIDHYEVLEVPTVPGAEASRSWQVATSPYLLQDQSLSSNIFVRAVDHDGNFIVVEVPAEHPFSGTSHASWDILFLLSVVLLMVILIARRLLRWNKV